MNRLLDAHVPSHFIALFVNLGLTEKLVFEKKDLPSEFVEIPRCEDAFVDGLEVNRGHLVKHRNFEGLSGDGQMG